ncbi:hypothetical protein HLV35_07470 [Eggerthellaceae bacterium zg-997]|nr:hypothetical protein [Eggerthellaceae bacterium zg-997]
MPVSEAQKRASAKYRREKVKQVAVSFYPSEADIYDHLRSQPNKSGYLKALIRADMNGRAEG